MRLNGLVLAGGEGSRLAGDGVSTPKALTPIAGISLAQRAIDGLRAAGCESVTVAIREPTAAWMTSHGIRLAGAALVRCETPSSLHTLVRGLESLPAGPALCTMVDSVMPAAAWAAVGPRLISVLEGGAAAVLATTSAAPDDAPLFVETDVVGRVTGFPSQAPTPAIVTAGIYLFDAAARHHASLVLSRGTERMRGFLKALIADRFQVGQVVVDRVIDVDHAADLARAESWLAPTASLLIHQ